MLERPITYQEIKEKLALHGLKATSQRLVIYETLCKSPQHPTAEMVFDWIHTANPSISLATVYKTLDTFADNGLVRRVASEDGSLRFDAHVDSHNHLYCTNTKEIIDFEDDTLQNLIQEFLNTKQFENFVIKDFQLQINGQKIDHYKTVKVHDKEKK
ncbi:MAG: transcriptional repressor [Raineya sp.]|nr:transcriptional repressor [Raineya sp.]